MSQRIVVAFTLVLVVMFALSCNKSNNTILSPSVPVELISNSSFENYGSPSLVGWTERDSLTVSLTRSAAPGGGNWSLTIAATWFPASYAKTTVPTVEGNHRYRFSFWGKHGETWIGGASILLKHSDTLSLLNSIAVADTAWRLYSVLDTLTTITRDSIVVSLSGGANEIIGGQTFFDLVKLEIIE
ncbi:MAG TPA: hypothetical protein VLY03_11395 [Bacteroidota bacterium]|nr:hypothetical protein [Bacteroidota bacterium]